MPLGRPKNIPYPSNILKIAQEDGFLSGGLYSGFMAVWENAC